LSAGFTRLRSQTRVAAELFEGGGGGVIHPRIQLVAIGAGVDARQQLFGHPFLARLAISGSSPFFMSEIHTFGRVQENPGKTRPLGRS
jgi:hypothetical protein